MHYTLTILPKNIHLHANEGDNLYTLLLLADLVEPGDPSSEYLCLERGSVSPPEDPDQEAATFTPAQRTEGWFLASQRRVSGDAVLRQYQPEDLTLLQDSADPLSRGYGMAFDLGSGTIAAGLVEMGRMNIPQLTACPNSQMALAPGPERRQALAETPQGRAQLRELLLGDMQYLLDKLCALNGVEPEQIKAITCAGSSLMLKLLPAEEPETPGGLHCFRSGDLGLRRLEEDTQVYLLPAAGSDLGADVTAACLAADLLHKMEQSQVTLLIDLGMSGEIIGAGRGRMVAASIPELPFEGRGIRYGMPTITGAITQVEIGQRVVVKTVRDARPKGISGAGLLSATRAMLEAGLLDEEGRIQPPKGPDSPGAENFRSGIDGQGFILSPGDAQFPQDIFIDQEDILNLQMAKGAIFAACHAVLHALDYGPEQISEILLAEAYRAHLQPMDLLKLGMVPAVAPERAVAIGNAAWQGAFLCLSNRHFLEEAQQLVERLQRLDLDTDPVYTGQFIQGMHFGPQQEQHPTAKARRKWSWE